MNILIIGGAGYIGSHVARTFLDAGHRVTVYDNMSLGSEQNLFEEAQFVKGDILDSQALEQCMASGFDGLIHLAAFKAAGESMIEPEKYSLNNINGTVNILNGASKNGIKNIVFSSSAAIFGEPEKIPIDEEHPKNPENYYGFTKLEIERFLAWYDTLRNIKYAALRYFNAAGYDPQGRIQGLEKNPANLLPVIMEVAAGWRPELSIFGNDYPTPDGTCIRDYVHVSDLASAHLLSLEYIDQNNESLTVNLGSGTGLSVMEMLDTARRITGQEIPSRITDRRPGDPAKLFATSAKAKELLGWKAQHSDAESLIESTWRVYRNASGPR